ncbi:MAG: translocation/assembly module TamB domain-containing protein, partial [Vulcanimicrobiota bacterium]
KPYGQRAIKTVEIHKPYALVKKLESGRWNMGVLFDPVLGGEPGEPLDVGMDTTLHIYDGKAEYLDNTGEVKYHKIIEPINGKVQMKDDRGIIEFLKLDTEENSGEIDVKGELYHDFSGIKAQVKSQPLKVGELTAYITSKFGIDLELSKGRAVIEGTVEIPAFYSKDLVEELNYNAVVYLDGFELRYEDIPEKVTDITGKAILATEYVGIERITAGYMGSPVRVTGHLFGFEEPVLQIYADIKNFQLENLEKFKHITGLTERISGRADVNARLTGRAEASIIKGNTTFDRIKVREQLVRNGNIDFRYFQNLVEFNLKNANWEEGTFSGDGHILSRKNKSYLVLELNGENANVGRLAHIIFPEYNIQAYSDFTVKILGTNEDPIIMGDSSFSGVGYKNLFLNSGETNFLYTSGKLLLSGLKIFNAGGAAMVPVAFIDLENEYLNLTVNTRNFPIPAGLMPNNNLTGSLNLEARVVGKFKNPVAFGTLENSVINYNGSNFYGTTGGFIYGNNTVFLNKVRAGLDGANLMLSGWAKKGETPEMEVVFNAMNLNPRELKNFSPALNTYPLDGRIDLMGALSGDRGVYHWQLLGDGSLGELVAYGNMDTHKKYLENTLAGWNLELEKFTPAQVSEIIDTDRANLALISYGNFNHLKNDFMIEMPSGEVLGLPLTRGVGEFVYKGNELEINDSQWVGFSSNLNRDDRFQYVADLYGLTTYWGADVHKLRRQGMLARMYYMPYMLEDYVYTAQGWQIKAKTLVPLVGQNIYGDKFPAVSGLPPIWNVEDFHQLRYVSDGGFPIKLEIEDTEGRDDRQRWRALDASISGNINFADETLNLYVNSPKLNLGIIEKNLDLSAVGISYDDIANTMQWEALEGNARIKGFVKGYWSNPIWVGNLSINDGIINNDYFALDACFMAREKGLEFDEFTLVQSQSKFTGQGRIDFQPEVALNLDLNAERGQLSRLLSFTPWHSIPAYGLINGDIHVDGNLDNLMIDTDITVDDAEIYHQPISRIDIEIDSTQDRVQLENFRAQLDGGEISGSGYLQNQNMNFNFNAQNLPLSEIYALKTVFPNIKGSTRFGLGLEGTVNQPRVTIDFATRKLVVRNEAVDVFKGNINWADNSLTIAPIQLEVEDSAWNLRGMVHFPKGRIPESWGKFTKTGGASFEVESSFRNWQIQKVLAMLDHPQKKNIEGTLNGSLSGSGSFPEYNTELNLQLSRGRVHDINFENFEISANANEDIINIRTIELAAENFSGNATGRYSEEEDTINLEAHAENIPVKLLHPFVPASRSVNGNFSVDSRIWGQTHIPNMETTVFLREGSFGPVQFDEFGGGVNARNGLVSLEDFALRKDKEKVDIKGEIPLAFTEGRLINSGPMEISADIREKDLNILQVFVPYIQNTSGSLNGNLSVTGIYPDLQIQGKTRIRNGNIKLTLLDNQIENFETNIDFNGKRLVVDKFSGNMGNGIFNLNGFARLDQETFSIEDMKFVFLGKNLTVLMPGLIRGRVDTKVTLTGAQDNMIIGKTKRQEGNDYLRVYNATLSMPKGELKNLSQLVPADEGQEGEQKTEAGLEIPIPRITNFIMTLGEDVWVDYQDLFIKASGSLKLVRLPNQSVRIFGELGFSKGTLKIPFVKTQFRVTKGTAYFHGGDPVTEPDSDEIKDYALNPSFDFSAETTISDYDIYMNYRGDMESLLAAFKNQDQMGISKGDLTMYSVPARSERQIMQLLLSSTFVGGLMEEEQGGTAAD